MNAADTDLAVWSGRRLADGVSSALADVTGERRADLIERARDRAWRELDTIAIGLEQRDADPEIIAQFTAAAQAEFERIIGAITAPLSLLKLNPRLPTISVRERQTKTPSDSANRQAAGRRSKRG
jgi:hypothetical protein